MKKIYITLAFTLFAVIANAQIDRSVMPKSGSAPEINLSEPQQFELKNGLKVLIVENHKLPRVSIQLRIDNPPIAEGEKAGTTSFVSSLLGNGSTTIPKDDFNEEVDFLGARMNFGSQSAFASSISKYFPRILELMADATINPNFTQEEFDKEKEKIITGLKSEEKDVASIAYRAQLALAYGKDHPYGEFTTPETVENISLADVKRFHANYFVPANAYLIVIGDVNTKEVQKLIKKNFTSWTKSTPPSFQYSRPKNALYTQINFIDIPNAVQSEIAVESLVDLKMSDEDYFPALIMNQILGGGGEGRLFLNLREDKGYTYGSYSSIGNDKYAPARFRATAQVRNAVTDSSVVEILKEVQRIKTELVSDKDLENAKAKYMGRFIMALEKPETIAGYALNIETEGLSDDYYKTYLERINSITVEDIQKVAQKYLTTDKLRIVVAGKGSEVLENLDNISFNGNKIPVKYYNKMIKEVEKPNYETALPEGTSIQTVIDNYFKAIGGKDKVATLTSLALVYEGSMNGAVVKIEEKRTIDRYAMTMYMNNTPMQTIISNGDELYMKQGENKMSLPESVATDMKNSLGIFPEQTFTKNGTGKLVGIEDVDDTKAYKIEVTGDAITASYYYDVESGLKIKETSVTNMNGQTQSQEAILKDYTETNGLMFPSIKISSFGPQKLESKLISATINTNVSDADFE
ncbi:insulinase family protein [Cellulophaga baltica]|uniref:M16 family metallopeptidase n=1 Tax=Cellulophaga TaxID=104264 RepID=UPI001C07A873|nr:MULTISPECIES: pitrilysin family protein [Cellulophaga]MBU2995612.1 insulinase family protein [Cellulophaga baltica]MDO6767006.1 pitrilysin family protein [Cellulophaga sp. 1_MG-2023]